MAARHSGTRRAPAHAARRIPVYCRAAMVSHEDERTRALDEILRMSSVPIETALPGRGRAGTHLYVLGCLERRGAIFPHDVLALYLSPPRAVRGRVPQPPTPPRRARGRLPSAPPA